IAGAPEELAKIALAAGKRIDGHAPGVVGSSLDAYLATGISSDHEATVLREGHIDQMCRVAVAQGISPEDALLLATLHPALCHGLPRVGAIAPGYRADCVLLDDLSSFRAVLVVKDGRVVARDGVAEPFASAPAPDWVRDSVRIAPLTADSFRLPHAGDRVRAIG